MDPSSRYQVLGVIAEGEYATILRARDQELGRDVAIKQIHEQFLHDPSQLERYWQEAQLLASLDHPYILTVYDIVRPKGWLILELMQGSIAQQLNGQPIDLDFLRVTLICGLHALRILSENNIVHGDVKPGNLLLDRANRVKLGDFGIARRLSGDDGSLVKGSTKYMAPEVVSDQFGPIGTHSDLYSLGFTAYELMCGSHFDMLFPGLDMYGGNRQMAWIMWHAALDRRLPEIPRVLEGVPEDLVHVIQKLTEKDPSKRYRTPDEALADLRTKAQLPGALPPPDPEASAAAAEAATKKDRRKRMLTIGAVVFSLVLSTAMLFIPSSSGSKGPKTVVSDSDVMGGVLSHVDLKRNNVFLETETGEKLPAVAFDPVVDRVYLDDNKVSIADLRTGDAIELRRMQGPDGKPILEVQASRDVATISGKIAALDASLGTLRVLPDEDSSSPLMVDVPRNAHITFNGMERMGGQAVTLASLKIGDSVTVRHVPSEGRRRATSLAAQRLVPLNGTVAGIDATQRKLSIRPSNADSSTLPKELSLAEDCVITINGQTSHAGHTFELEDLRVGDDIETEHQTDFVKINVNRRLDHRGMVKTIDPAAGTLTVQLESGAEEPVTFHVDSATKIAFSAGQRPLQLAQLRPKDSVEIVHNSPDLKSALAKQITVHTPFDTQTWALVVGEQQYDDARLDPLSTTQADAEAVQLALLDSRRIAENQVVYLANPARGQLEQAVTSISEQAKAGNQLLLFFAGHAYIDAAGNAQLAPRDFDSKEMDKTGLGLRWVVDTLQKSAAKEKLLILDTSHEGSGDLAAKQPSAAELAESLRPRPGRPLSSSVTILVSTGPGEHGLPGDKPGLGAFAEAVSTGLAGAADVNGDGSVQANELYASVKNSLSKLTDKKLTPQLFLPDATPERLNAEARQGVRQLLAYLGHNQLDATAFQAEYDQLQKLAPNQPDFNVAAGLVLLKHGKTSFSTQLFEGALALAPESKVAHQALAWQDFTKKNYDEGTDHLVRLLSVSGQSDLMPAEGFDEYLLEWAGELAAYLQEFVPGEGPLLSKKLADAASKRGASAQKLFQQGQQNVLQRKKLMLEEFQLATSESQKNQLRFRAKLLTSYTQFGFDQADEAVKTEIEY